MKKVYFFTFHMPLDTEPGAFRPWMEAKLMRDAGYQVVAITSNAHYMTSRRYIQDMRTLIASELIEGIQVFRIWAPSDYRKSILKRIITYLSFAIGSLWIGLFYLPRRSIIFAGTDPVPIIPIVVILRYLKSSKLFLDERDLNPETAISLGVVNEGVLTQIIARILKSAREVSDGILVATPGLGRKLKEYGISQDKINLLYNADVYMLKTENGIDTSPKKMDCELIVGYFGGLGMANDVMTMLEAAHLLADYTEIQFKIVGAGENKEKYKDFVRSNNLTNVEISGPYSRDYARKMAAKCDLLVQPLHDQEHFNYTLTSKTFDYMALGKAILFAGRGDTRTLLTESGGGYFVDPGDAAEFAKTVLNVSLNQDDLELKGQKNKQWFRDKISCDKSVALISKFLR